MRRKTLSRQHTGIGAYRERICHGPCERPELATPAPFRPLSNAGLRIDRQSMNFNKMHAAFNPLNW